MKTRIALIAACVALVSGCGTDLLGNGDGGTSLYTFTTGTYQVTNALATGVDECGLVDVYQDPAKKIDITVGVSTVDFNLGQAASPPANQIPKATLSDDQLVSPVESNYTLSYTGPDCVVRVKQNVTGNVVANNTGALTLSFSVQKETGTCNSSNTVFSAVPCSSTYEFTATKL